MLADFSYFAIKYDVEFDNLLTTILILPQIYLWPILLYFFYY